MDNFFISAVEKMLRSAVDGMASWVTTAMVGTQESIIKLIELPIITNILSTMQTIALSAMLPLGLVILITVYILKLKGMPDRNAIQLFIKVMLATWAIGAAPNLVKVIIEFTLKIISDIGMTGGSNMQVEQAIMGAAVPGLGIIPLALMIILVLIGIIIAVVQSYQRGAMLALLLIISPLAFITFLMDSTLPGQWLKEVISIALGILVQIMLLNITMILIPDSLMSLEGMMMVIGVVMATISAPKFIQNLITTAGTSGKMAGMGARTAGMGTQMAMQSKMMTANMGKAAGGSAAKAAGAVAKAVGG